MNTITPHLWFDTQAREAAEFYVSLFDQSKITNTATLRNTPSGDTEMVSFELGGQPFMAISAGPFFKLNPSVSFFANFDPSRDGRAEESLNAAWDKLSQGGTALMELGEYPFSRRYGWIQDKFGVSWQLMLTNPAGEPRPFIIPSLMFVGDNAGRAEEAINFYRSIFKDSKMGSLARYGAGREPDREGTVMSADFKLLNLWLAAMDSAYPHKFSFNEAVSFLVRCDTQEEIDYYWEKLSAVPEAEQCGWLKDKFGVSWQITPAIMDALMRTQDQEKLDRVTQAFLKMKKFDIAALQKAADGH
jgi:predicted 3-demethylubiquinone-9 3-methyltransferase (glyoxalase superfamily)